MDFGLSPKLRAELRQFPEVEKRLASAKPTIVVSLSGGLDSVALLLWAISNYPHANVIAHHQAIIEDWYSAIPYNRQLCERLDVPLSITQAVYVRRLRTYKNGRLSEMGWQGEMLQIPDSQHHPYTTQEAAAILGENEENVAAGILDFAEARNAPPTNRIRWCTSYFKVRAFNSWVRANRDVLGTDSVALVGYRRAESKKRSKSPVAMERQVSLKAGNKEYPDGWSMWDLHPLLDWRKADTASYLQEHGIEPHLAYEAQGLDFSQPVKEKGPRFSCVNCIFANGCHMAASTTFQDGVPKEETQHIQWVMQRTLDFQEKSGMTWQQGSAIGMNKVAIALGEPVFVKGDQLSLDLGVF